MLGSNGASALRVKDLTVRFAGILALDHVTVTVGPGEVVAVVGSNGAGKSTLLNALCGLLRRNAVGEIELYGESLLGRRPWSIAALGIGRSFQEPRLIESGTVLENILCGAHLQLSYRMPGQLWAGKVLRAEGPAIARAVELLRLAGLERYRHAPVSGLPFGVRKIVDIIRAIVAEPRLLVLDEPTSGLDDDEQLEVVQLLKAVKQELGLTAMVVEHNMDVVRLLADTAIGMHAGRVITTGSAHEVLDSTDFLNVLTGSS